MALPSPSSSFFYYHYLSFRLLGDTPLLWLPHSFLSPWSSIWGAAAGGGGLLLPYIFFYLQFKLSFLPFSLSLSLSPLCTPPLCIIYSHFLAIKIELCCRIFACSATLQHWWIILHPANWRASLSFMSALCWFTIKTYCTVLWVEA